eukprot:gnl/TRDRNA2_/TRDRNA2_201679_c0_seq1.p1 gnl/TRDRNA2_/TRDRNA2_201679_c0~~gnl/TRDRNA2_/TRDRNA2_201679_c0_seq1.p1  ORF type:complete len:376 (+),score=64.54 gnl/TRDRNA2_/TRDRNA2_201679_c0_seq1:118-1128(+)
MTDDDMFSADLSEVELRIRLGHISVPTLLVSSADDEYVPSSVDGAALAHRLAAAMACGPTGAAEVLVLQQGGHGVRPPAAMKILADATEQFLAKLSGSPRCDQGVLRGVTWEPAFAQELREQAAKMPAGRPLLVALAGLPGSGKTTAAAVLERLLTADGAVQSSGSRGLPLVVPMDGFHLPLAALRARPDAADAVYRRGAPDTFDPSALRVCLGDILGTGSDSKDVVYIPGFDHAIGDPTADAHCFKRAVHSIVIVEGLYLLYDGGDWAGTADIFDLRVFLDEDIEVSMARVKERNKVIPGYTPEQIAIRVEEVDRRNALTVRETASRADRKFTLY